MSKTIELRWTYYPSELLKKKTREIEDIQEGLEIGSRMKEMLAEEGGLGLAGNQAGIDMAIVVVAFPGEENKFDDFKILINPKIVFESPKKILGEEGCLSFPGLYVDIERPSEVIIRAYLEGTGMTSIQARGMLAIILSHEIDHLQGITIPNRLDPIKREIIQPQLDKIAEEYGKK